jgi:hypothetical protein
MILKDFSAYQVREAAKLGTQGSIHRIYGRDPEMAKSLSLSNAASLITPEMKEDLQVYRSNNIFSNYKKRRIFKPPNNWRLDWRALDNLKKIYNQKMTNMLKNGVITEFLTKIFYG